MLCIARFVVGKVRVGLTLTPTLTPTLGFLPYDVKMVISFIAHGHFALRMH